MKWPNINLDTCALKTGAALVLWVGVMINSQAAAQELPWTHFSPDHLTLPLPSASVQVVHQDRLGYIWFGFYSSGLGRYDGHSLEIYDIPDGLASSTVREVVEDGQGFLWVGSDAGVVVSEKPLDRYVAQQRIRFRSSVAGIELAQTRVRLNWLAASPDGSVFVATAGREVIRYRIGSDGVLTVTRFDFGSGSDELRDAPSALTVRGDGSVWLALEQRTVLTLAPGATEFIDTGLGRTLESGVQVFYEGPSGNLWGGCLDGMVWRLDESGEARQLIPVSRLLSDTVQTLLGTSSNELWVGSIGAGVLRVESGGKGNAEVLTRRNGLPSETVWDLTEDREGNLWVAHNAGVSRLRSDYRAFNRYTAVSRAGETPVLPESAVFAVIPRPTDEPSAPLWVGTGGGLVAIRPDGASVSVNVSDGLTSSAIYALATDVVGRLWVGTYAGLDVLSFGGRPLPPIGVHRRSRLSLFGGETNLDSYNMGTVYACRELPMAIGGAENGSVSAIWVAGAGGLACFVAERWFLFAAEAGLPAAGSFMIEAAPDGRLWVATSDTGILTSREPVTLQRLDSLLQHTDRSSHREITAPFFQRAWNRTTGAPSDSVHNLVWVGDRMWAGTASGLATVESHPPRTGLLLNRDNGLGGDRVMAMARSPVTGTLWVSQNEGIAEVDPVNATVLRVVSKQDGLIDNEVWLPSALAIGEDGTILFGTPKGLSQYRPDLQRANPVPPLLRLRRSQLQQDRSGNNEVVFEYAALSFANEQRVRYRTRLLGYRNQWSADKSDVLFRFTNLPALLIPRTYTFEVLAANDCGVWTEDPLRYEFQIQPALWLRWWAVGAFLVVAGLAVVGFIQLHTRRLTLRTKGLEKLVAVRTTEIESRARELETLDQIVETINREVVLEKVMEALLEQGLILVPQADRAVFLLRDSESRQFRIAAVSGWVREQAMGITFSVREALERYTAKAQSIVEGVRIIDGLSNRPGSDRVKHLSVSETNLAIDLQTGGELQAFLVFDITPGDGSHVSFDARTLQRYRQHAISALDKARVVRELEEKSREAAQASAAKSAFLAAMSHELRTPLNSIIGFSEILLKRLGAKTDARLVRFVHNILSSGKHLLALINDILDLSKIEAGRMPLDLAPADLSQVVDGVSRIMVGVASKRNIKVLVDLPDDLPSITVDSPKLKQILYNLVSNAVKFSPDNSSVTISARTLSAAVSPLGIDAVSIAVKDQGIGIREEDHELIFEEFRQLDTGASRRYVGTGLGLGLVRRFVELQGGQVTVDSAPQAGSTFTVVIPVDVSQRVDEERTQPGSLPPAG
ncbi:MAG: hypothetical protein K8R59_10260 [Thermoanaerobaculales bacterium]|nr:hypothetical protein [Thermoanaerobaculales bacterium]